MEGRVRKALEQVDGPLWPHAERIVADLEAQGYARNSINAQMWLVARLSRWLNSEGLALRDLTARELDRFEKRRWERGGFVAQDLSRAGSAGDLAQHLLAGISRPRCRSGTRPGRRSWSGAGKRGQRCGRPSRLEHDVLVE
jgi:hypothetical protein